MSQVVDIGCGDGGLIRGAGVGSGGAWRKSLRRSPTPHTPTPFFGLDRNLGRAVPDPNVTYVTSLDEIPPADARLIISNELFDALPFARLVQRGEHLHELWVTERDGALDWSEHEAERAYDDYFAERGITLDDGQFADVSLEWAALYDDICRFVAARADRHLRLRSAAVEALSRTDAALRNRGRVLEAARQPRSARQSRASRI